MKKIPLFLILFIAYSLTAQTPVIKTGIDVIAENNFHILSGKKVGLITNPTGVNSQMRSTIDILNDAENVELVALFGPEHGVRGNYTAGAKIGKYTDEKTGLPVYSLYGKTRKPTEEMLEGIDALVYDIQDIGSRSYTYISTMGLAMESAAENKIEFVVLDRPNPLGGNRIEGCSVEEGYFSFVSQFPIPYVYGLTCGELALYLNGEGLLQNGEKCELTVIPMEGWKRNMVFPDLGLQWVLTSPHIPHAESAFYYPATGVIGEMNIFSIGVGYTLPFEIMAADFLEAETTAQAMNDLHLPGVIFRPISFKPYYAFGQGEEMHGVQIHITDFSNAELLPIQFYFMQAVHRLHPEFSPFDSVSEGRIRAFDKVIGTSRVREEFSKRFLVEDILPILNEDIENFSSASAKYYLYDPE